MSRLDSQDSEGGITTLPDRFRLGGRLIDTALNRVDGQAVDGKYVEVLKALATAAPNPISTANLLDVVWRDLVVGDNVVHQAIAQLRRVLGDNARKPVYIETIPRVGYRLIAPVTPLDLAPSHASQLTAVPTSSQSHGRWLALGVGALLMALAVGTWITRNGSSTDRGSDLTTVAVLQIRDLSQDGHLSWLSDGVAMELRHQIANLKNFEVLPRVLGMAEGQSPPLKPADLVLDGAVREDGEYVEIHLELTRLADGELLWRQSFPGRNDDAWLLQTQIATSIVRYFDASLLGISGPENPVAYEYYLRFLQHQWGGNADEERRLLERALEADPGWSAGWEQLGILAQSFASWRRDRSDLDVARAAIEKARTTSGQPDYGTGVEAQLLAYWDDELCGAEELYRSWPYTQAHNYAFLMLSSGLCAEALAAEQIWSDAHPYNIGGLDYLAMGHACLGDAEGAVNAALRTVGLMSPDAYRGTLGLIWGLPQLGRFAEAQALLVRFDHIAESVAKGSINELLIHRYRKMLIFEIAIAQRDFDTARSAAEFFIEIDDHVRAGIMLLALGDPRAEHHLNIAAELPVTTAMIWLWHRPFIPAELREHPAIRRLEDAMGFTLAWRAELCARTALAPARFNVSCNPDDYPIADPIADQGS